MIIDLVELIFNLKIIEWKDRAIEKIIIIRELYLKTGFFS
jgi:hypothetical protein